jgi:cobalt-zinc-cadmium efflux system membrane fusion protein
MKTIWLPLFATAVGTAVVTVALTRWAPWQAPANAARTESPIAEAVAKNGTVTYAPDAAQLSYLRVEAVRASAVPLVESLAARIAYDENRTVRISTPVSGRVFRILAQPGDRVAAGAVLAEIDAPDFAQAVADQRKAHGDLTLKRSAFERATALLEAGVIARKEFESAQADLKASEAETERSADRLRSLGGASNGRYALRTPIAGVVAERSLNPGQEARNDAPNPLFVVTDPSSLWAIADLTDADLGKVSVGQILRLEVDAFPGERFEAKVTSVGIALDPSTRRVQVRAVLANPGLRLRPEMFARVSAMPASSDGAFEIPNAALVTTGARSFVFVRRAPGTFERREVTLAAQGHERSYASSGLKPGEEIVTSGATLVAADLGKD